jgi:hypothetical protein
MPVRKPTPHVIKRDNLRIDEDGICMGHLESGAELSDINNQTRTRFQDILANSLNARRAVRDIALPVLVALQKDIAGIRAQLDRIESQLAHGQT